MVKKIDTLKYYQSVGRRKEAVARVRLHIAEAAKSVTFMGNKVQKGEIFVNSMPVSEYFPSDASFHRYRLPLTLTQNLDRFAITIKVHGGGREGQLDALIHGIARALVLVDDSYKSVLREHGLLTRDARTRERRMVGMGGKSRRKKQSPKR